MSDLANLLESADPLLLALIERIHREMNLYDTTEKELHNVQDPTFQRYEKSNVMKHRHKDET